MHILIPALHRPSKPTGVCRHAVNLAQCLAATDRISRITLLVGGWQHGYFKQSFNLESPKIQLKSIDIRNSSLSRNQWFVFGLPQLAQQLQPDIIHMSFPFPFVRRWFKVPVVSTIHDLYPFEYPENFGYPQVWFNLWFLRQCIVQSDGLSCVSKSTLKSLEHYFPNIDSHKKIAVVYNYVDFSHIIPRVPEAIASQEISRFILSVAQHRKNKNLDLLINAYYNLQKSDALQSKTKLLIVGSPGPETDKLTHLVQTWKLEGEILFLSGLEDGELRWLYEQASLFIIPSSTEGFCLPLLEALTLSCPVVCSDIPIFREVGSSRCRYFKLDHQACNNLAEAISSELAYGTTREKALDSRFSSKEVSQQLLSFYESLHIFT